MKFSNNKTVRHLLLVASFALVSQAYADVCNGPELSNISVLPNGLLEIHGVRGIARSSDEGRTWTKVAGSVRSPKPFWERRYQDASGILYQNIKINGAPFVIFSKDEGRTWVQKDVHGLGTEILILWGDSMGVFMLAGGDLQLHQFRGYGSIGFGEKAYLEGLHGGHEIVTETNNGSLNIKYTQVIQGEHRFLSFELDGRTLRKTYSESDPYGESLKSTAMNQELTGFHVGKDRSIYISTPNRILVGKDFGVEWRDLNLPADWPLC